MDLNTYYNMLMDSTKSNKSSRYFKTQNQKDEEEYQKTGYKQFDNYRDENGAIHIGDEIIQDNEDATFTDSTGKKLSIDDLNTKLRTTNEAKTAEETDTGGGFLEGAGDFFQGIGEGAWKGGAGIVGSGASLVSSLITGDADNDITNATKDWQKSADEWGDSVNANGVGEFIGNLPGGIVSGIVDPASYMVRGVRNTPEMIAASIAAGSSDKFIREEGIKAQKDLQARQFGDDVAERGDGAMLMEGIAKPGEAILNVATGGAASAVTQGVKQGGKQVAKEMVKQGGINVAAGVPLSTLEQAARGQEITLESVGKDALIQGVTGATIGGFSKYRGIKKENKLVQGGEEFAEQMDASKASREKAAADEAQLQKIRDDMETDYLKRQQDESFARDAEMEMQDMRDGNFSDDMFDTVDSEGNPVTPENIEAATAKQVETLTARRDEIAAQVDKIADPAARESAMRNVNQLDDQIAQITSGDTNALMQTGGAGMSRTLNTGRVRDRYAQLADIKTNTAKPLADVNAELTNIVNGVVPDSAKRPIPEIASATDIIGRDYFDSDTRAAALDIVTDANKVTEVLDNLMTPQRYEATAAEIDAKYQADVERINQMPARRQERELAKLDEKYEADLDALDAEMADAAPAVEEYSNMLAFLKSKEDQLVVFAETSRRENPGTALETDPIALEGKVNELVQQQKIAEIGENMPETQKPLVASVTNGVRPSENTNPIVANAIDDAHVATANIIDNPGSKNVNPGFISNAMTAPREVLNNMGEPGKKISSALDSAHDSVSIADQQVGIRTVQWTKDAGGKKGMREVAKALDGDGDAFSALNPRQQEVFSQVRDMFTAYAEDLGLPAHARIKDYLPHMFNEKGLSDIDSAVMQLSTGKTMAGKELTQGDISKLNKTLKGIDYATLEMIKKNSMFKLKKNGFLEKRTGVDDYSFELGEIIAAYTHAAHNTIHMNPALEVAKQYSPQLNAMQNEYLAKVIVTLEGRPTESLGKMLDESLSKVLGGRDNAYSQGSATARKLVYDALLGANPASAIRNLNQGANTFAKLGTRYTASGAKDAMSALKSNSNAYDELVDAGVLMSRYSDLLREGKRADLQRNFDGGLWFMFERVERFNRATAYFGAKQRHIDKYIAASKKKGVEVDVNNLPDDVASAARAAGREMSRGTQFEFGAMDIPLAQQGTTAKNLIQFQSYNLAQVKFLKNMFVGDTDSLFVKNDSGKGYRLSGQGAMQLARYTGANLLFMSTVGSLIGMTPEEQIPFFDNAKAALTGDAVGAIPRSPLTQLLIGNGKGKDGLFQLGGTMNKAITGDEKAQENLFDDAVEYGKTAASSLLPGGSQAKKTIEGVSTTEQGFSENASGKIRFLQDTDFASKLRAGLFGQYQTDAGRQWVADGFPTFSEKQTSKIKGQETLNDQERYADMYVVTKGRQAAVDAVKTTYANQGNNAAMRKAQEWNAQQDAAIAEYRKKHPGALPKEIADSLNKSKINYSNLRMSND